MNSYKAMLSTRIDQLENEFFLYDDDTKIVRYHKYTDERGVPCLIFKIYELNGKEI